MSPSCPTGIAEKNSAADAGGSGNASRLAGKLAALTGAAGATLAGEAVAAPIGYTPTPTAGVLQAQGISGFSYVSPTNITPGELRPPASAGHTLWDIDGNGKADFSLDHGVFGASETLFVEPIAMLQPLSPYAANLNGLLAANSIFYHLKNLAPSPPGIVGAGATVWRNYNQSMTYNQDVTPLAFTLGQAGYFGFRFAFNNTPATYYYGWGSLTIDATAPGQGYKITEAYYQSTPNTAISVGDVPLAGPAPVPELSGEPSGMALLAAGFFGLEALRARRRRLAVAC